MAYAPKPWEAEDHGEHGIYVWGFPGYEGNPDNRREVCVIHTWEGDSDDMREMDQADACLIAAAPDLHDACKAALDYIVRNEQPGATTRAVEEAGDAEKWEDYMPTTYDTLKAAIQKAEGSEGEDPR